MGRSWDSVRAASPGSVDGVRLFSMSPSMSPSLGARLAVWAIVWADATRSAARVPAAAASAVAATRRRLAAGRRGTGAPPVATRGRAHAAGRDRAGAARPARPGRARGPARRDHRHRRGRTTSGSAQRRQRRRARPPRLVGHDFALSVLTYPVAVQRRDERSVPHRCTAQWALLGGRAGRSRCCSCSRCARRRAGSRGCSSGRGQRSIAATGLGAVVRGLVVDGRMLRRRVALPVRAVQRHRPVAVRVRRAALGARPARRAGRGIHGGRRAPRPAKRPRRRSGSAPVRTPRPSSSAAATRDDAPTTQFEQRPSRRTRHATTPVRATGPRRPGRDASIPSGHATSRTRSQQCRPQREPEPRAGRCRARGR